MTKYISTLVFTIGNLEISHFGFSRKGNTSFDTSRIIYGLLTSNEQITAVNLYWAISLPVIHMRQLHFGIFWTGSQDLWVFFHRLAYTHKLAETWGGRVYVYTSLWFFPSYQKSRTCTGKYSVLATNRQFSDRVDLPADTNWIRTRLLAQE